MVRGALLAARRCRRKDPRRSSSRTATRGGYRSNERCAITPDPSVSGIFAGRTPSATRLDPHRLAADLRVVRGVGQDADPLVALLPLGQLEQRLDAEGVVGQPGVLVADLREPP